MIERLLQDLQGDEGWREKPYRDSEGYLTIGFGFLIDERKPVSLPKPVGLYWLEYLAEQTWYAVQDRLPWIIDHPEKVQRALTNMAYQMGIDGLMGFRNMLDAVQAGRYEEAAEHALDSKWARQTPKRAKRVTDLIRGAA